MSFYTLVFLYRVSIFLYLCGRGESWNIYLVYIQVCECIFSQLRAYCEDIKPVISSQHGSISDSSADIFMINHNGLKNNFGCSKICVS